MPCERLRWRYTRQDVTNPLIAAAHAALDEDELRDNLCVLCRDTRNPPDGSCCSCGRPLGNHNPNFDEERFNLLAGRLREKGGTT